MWTIEGPTGVGDSKMSREGAEAVARAWGDDYRAVPYARFAEWHAKRIAALFNVFRDEVWTP